MALCSSA